MIIKNSCLVLILSLLVATAPARAETAQEMLSGCKEVASARKDNEGVTVLKQDFHTAACWGGLAVVQFVTRLGQSEQNRLFNACVPEGVSRTRMAEIFIKYTDNNPERLNEEFFIVAISSLQKAFPCK